MRTIADNLEPGALYLVISKRSPHILDSHNRHALSPAILSRCPANLEDVHHPHCDALIREALCPHHGWGYALYFHEADAPAPAVGTMFHLDGGGGHEGWVGPRQAPDPAPDDAVAYTHTHARSFTHNHTDNHALISTRDEFVCHVTPVEQTPVLHQHTIGLARLARVPPCLLRETHRWLCGAARALAPHAARSRFEWACMVAAQLRAHAAASQQQHGSNMMEEEKDDDETDAEDEEEDFMAKTRAAAQEVLPWIAQIVAYPLGMDRPRPIMVTGQSVGLAWAEISLHERGRLEARWRIRQRQDDIMATFLGKSEERTRARRARLDALANRAVVDGTGRVSEQRVLRELALREAEERARRRDVGQMEQSYAISGSAISEYQGLIEARWKAGETHWEQCAHAAGSGWMKDGMDADAVGVLD